MLRFYRRAYHCCYGEACALSDRELSRIIHAVGRAENVDENYGWVLFDMRMAAIGTRG